MKAKRFKGWFAKLPLLNQPQRRQVPDTLHPAAWLEQTVAFISPFMVLRLAALVVPPPAPIRH